MKPTLINDKMIARLQHCDDEINDEFNTLEMLEVRCKKIESQVDPEHSVDLMGLLSGYLQAKTMSHWFHGGDVETVKNLCYNLLKMKYICGQPPCNTPEPWYAVEDSVFYLLSDHEPLITWFGQLIYDYETEVNHKESSNLNDGSYYSLQLGLALRGDFDLLGERAERFINNPPKNWAKRYLSDNQFYLALVNGDEQGMESVIRELATPRKIYQRRSAEGPYTENLVSSLAIRYSKLAWRHGHEIIVDSPYIPKEWIPVKPLEHYEDVFDFMKAYPV